jgi:tripartite-type tricarboxylate transporter receptor subunit TctC
MAMALSNIQEGKLLALGVVGSKRSSALPDVPTMVEAGVKLEEATWFGMWAPAGIPAGVKDKLAKDVARTVFSPDVSEQLTKLGAEPMSMTPEEFERFVRNEMEAAARIVKAAGIKPQ